MKPGPPSKPTALKILEGCRADRVNQNEPKPSPLISDELPDGLLTDDARNLWRYLAPRLTESGLLTSVDTIPLVMLCNLWGQYKNVASESAGNEIVQAPRTNSAMRNPAVDITHRTVEIMLRIMVEFGMTPSSRSRLDIKTFPKDVDEMERLIES